MLVFLYCYCLRRTEGHASMAAYAVTDDALYLIVLFIVIVSIEATLVNANLAPDTSIHVSLYQKFGW
jgi:hypothetical protein